ncbi:hypothetical protein [Spirosoma agri]|uniref:HNH endonuclease n=1 Tax=Spirosoma agri TaxID=1987381 RepID=A0A6M0IJJ7_9BACT|nr:hypothetical protein [Spirosoma agri]NEU67795.1 hypothetical protein [Spirosoma agri]
MLQIVAKPEPHDFDLKVRIPGSKFLALVPKPRTQDWKGKEYWRDVLPELRTAYEWICAYCATKIPRTNGEPTVDHFEPRASSPLKAYEWNNFRLASKKFNSRKHVKAIVDPFNVKPNWFIIDFDTFLIKPNDEPNFLTKVEFELIKYTIKELKLNTDQDLVEERIEYITSYIKDDCSLIHLERWVPFIAYELKRQKLELKIKLRRI